MTNITPTLEDYLETMLLLEKKRGEIRVTDIAAELNVAKSSVHVSLHSLADRGLIIQEKYSTLKFTEEGRRVSGEIYARHRALKQFFIEVVQVSPEIAERDACAVEHVISEQSLKRIIELTEEKMTDKNQK